MRIARDLGYEVLERDVVRTDLYHADEVFFTGTAAEVTPIRSVDDHEIGPGPITKRDPGGLLRRHARPLAALGRVPRLPDRGAPRARERRQHAHDPALGAGRRPARGGARARGAALGMLVARPVRLRASSSDFAAFAGTRTRPPSRAARPGLHLARAPGRHRPRRRGDHDADSASSPRPTASSTRAATPVFADVDPVTLNIDPAAIEAAITPRTRAILPVHIFGYPCEIERINEIAARHGLAVIEDAAEAVGARRAGRHVGTHGNPAIFAFYPNKQMTTGEGGMVTTDDAAVQAALQSLANQGRADTGDWLEHDRLGFNYRLDELSAARRRRAGRAARPDPRAAGRGRGALRRAARRRRPASTLPAADATATCARGSSTSCGSTPRSTATR